MAGFNTVRSAMRLSAILVAAGTILGVSANASAQSRLERAQRELQRAEQALNEARREAGQTRQAQQKAQVEREFVCRGACEGCEGCEDCDDPEQIEADVEADDDGEEQVIIHQPQGARRIERRIEAQRADGECCPTCGRPMNEGAPGRIQLRGQAMPGALGELGGLGAFHGLPGHNPHVQVFGGVGGEGARGSHRAIVVGPGGQPHEFKIKLDGPDGPSDGAEGRAEIRRFHIQTEGGESPFHSQPGQERDAAGVGGAPGVSGKIIIIGPDGRRQEFDLGGNPGEQNPPRRRAPRVQIENFRDGQAPGAHPQQGEQRRTIQVRKISHGAPI